MLQEFKTFIERGNVIDFAVAVIMAAAFGNIVTSLTADILMPIIGMAFGGVDFAQMKSILTPAVLDSNGTIVQKEVAVRYGQFLKYVVDFLIVAFILFLVVKMYNRVTTRDLSSGPSDNDLLSEIRDLLKKD